LKGSVAPPPPPPRLPDHALCALRDREGVGRGSTKTNRDGLEQTLDEFAGTRVFLEPGSQSRWMSRHLRAHSFDVRVADPRRVHLISKDPRKTERRGTEVLERLEGGMPELGVDPLLSGAS
jgi:hypothetical protein